MRGIAVKALHIMLCLLLLTIFSVKAQQLSFSKVLKENDYLFSYQWLDHLNQPQSIRFSLTHSALFSRFRMLKPFQNEFAQKTIMRAIKQQLLKHPLNNAQAIFRQKSGKQVIEINAIAAENIVEAQKKIKAMEQVAIKEYYQKNYYQTFTTHDQQFGIKINHRDIANDSINDFKALKPIILDKVAIENIRAVTDLVLSFVQSIPYSPLESRLTSSGSGFNPPAKLLWENQGDCDSKMTLTATLLRALMPRIPLAFIYIDNHAFIGINTASKPGEITVTHQGLEYVLGEPTGPALYSLGSLAPESELAITQGRYVIEAFSPK